MVARFIKSSLALALAIMTPEMAFAHTGVGGTSGFVHGFLHPVSGLDHVLAMVMVGVFAWQRGGRAIWLVPASFLAVMAAGGALGVMGAGVPFAETGIALSVVVLGAIVAPRVKASVAAAMGVVACFGLFHGYAHGAEMPDGASGLAYAAGFLIATAGLHAGGIGAGFVIGRTEERYGSLFMRSAGGLATLAGIGLLAGLI